MACNIILCERAYFSGQTLLEKDSIFNIMRNIEIEKESHAKIVKQNHLKIKIQTIKLLKISIIGFQVKFLIRDYLIGILL